MKNTQRFPHLLDCAIFADMTTPEKSAFFDQFTVQKYTKATTFLHQGALISGIYIVATGSIEVSFLSEEGHETIICHLGPLSVLGVLEALADKPSSATCRAMPDSYIMFCPTSVLLQTVPAPLLLRSVALIGYRMIKRDNWNKSLDQHYIVEQRICSHLWHMSAQNADIRLSQSSLADMVGCSRQTVNRELGVLRGENTIATSKGLITVRDRNALLRRVSQIGNDSA